MTYTIVSPRKRTYLQNQVNDKRVTRTFMLMKYMREWRTIKECSEYIGIKPRSIHRYFHLLMGMGFEIETNYGSHFVHRISNYNQFFDL